MARRVFLALAGPTALGLALTLGAPALSQDSDHPDSALSCRLQAMAPGQRSLDFDKPFAPIVIRFDEAPEATATSTKVSVYDPENLLKGAKARSIHLGPSQVRVLTDIDGPGGILDVVATDFEHPNPASPPFRAERGNWVGSVSLVGPEPYQALGPCYYSHGVALQDDTALVIQMAR